MKKQQGGFRQSALQKGRMRRNMEQNLEKELNLKLGKQIGEASKEELYKALLCLTKERMQGMQRNTGNRKLYYISAEFLIGKLLSNNLINLGLFEEVRELLKKHGQDLTEVEEVELEPSLGNGGLGRLAACFLDSIATLGLNGDGVGLNYHDGLFLQKFRDNKQQEEKNPWITPDSWLTRTDVSFEVPFKDFVLRSSMYDIDVPGYHSGCNKLHLFDLDSVDESIIGQGIQFDKKDIHRNLTLFLYPDDSDEDGQLLRIYQQYFMVSNAAQLIIKEAEERGVNLYQLHEHVCVQINDTHPTMIIPELIRILTQKKGFNMDTAVDVVRKTCAYTNHTILAEALEKWPVDYLEKVVPHLMPIIRDLDARVRRDFQDEKVYIIDSQNRVHMAHIDIHFGYAVNGVAALHTDILKKSELKPFYDIYPEKFNNKTNGITFRRWLVHCNHRLAAYLEELIGPEYLEDAKTEGSLPDFWDLGPELTRPARALKLWTTLQIVGTDRFGEMIDHGCRMAELAQEEILKYPGWEIVSPAGQGVVCFRYAPKELSDRECDALNVQLARELSDTGYAQILTTQLNGRKVLRMCTPNPETDEEDIRSTIALLNRPLEHMRETQLKAEAVSA